MAGLVSCIDDKEEHGGLGAEESERGVGVVHTAQSIGVLGAGPGCTVARVCVSAIPMHLYLHIRALVLDVPSCNHL